jgi:ATP-dependent exoDNAse (exonuclease V) beta subunit
MKAQKPLTEKQIQTLFHDHALPPLLVRASAGTGKTYRLTGRLLQILFLGGSPESILATTFTRKAAGEILTRILTTLANAADPDQPNALADLRSQVGNPNLQATDCAAQLKSLLADIHRLRICTLDSLFTQLAKSFPFELRLPPNWRLTDEIEEAWIREQAVDSLLSMLDPAEMTALLSMLSKGEVKRSISRDLVRIVAESYRIARDASFDAWEKLDAPTAPDNPALTDAAGMFRTADPPQKSVRKKLQAIADVTEAREFESLEKDTLIQNYAKAKRENSEVKFGRSKLPGGLDDALGALYAAVRSRTLALLAAQNRATGEVIALYDSQVHRLKEKRRGLAFDDIAFRLANFLGNVSDQSLARRLDGAIDHVLLDEFQDTSPMQWQVLAPFARRVADLPASRSPQPSTTEAKQSFFCVGDTKQAIYGWRGGVAEIFESVDDLLGEIQSIPQNRSYRSSPVIMQTVTEAFKHLHRHPICDAVRDNDDTNKTTFEAQAVVRFANQFPAHDSAKADLPGYVKFVTAPKVDSKEVSEKALACYRETANQVAELNQVAPQRTIGILTRTNKVVAQMIFLLERLGVEVSQEGGNPLIDSAAVELVLSALMMAEHPGDGRWEFHVRHSPLGKLESLTPDFVRQQITEYGIAHTVQHLCSSLAPSCDPRDTLRLKQLNHLAIQYESNPTTRLRDFVRMVREKRIERPQEANVRVMTVHQAKGLEFDAVFLPELDATLSGRPPLCVVDSRTPGEPAQAISRYLGNEAWHFFDKRWRSIFGQNAAGRMTESLCLLYVAMTRPRQALYLVAPPFKPDANKASAFVYAGLGCSGESDAGETLLFETGTPDWWADR